MEIFANNKSFLIFYTTTFLKGIRFNFEKGRKNPCQDQPNNMNIPPSIHALKQDQNLYEVLRYVVREELDKMKDSISADILNLQEDLNKLKATIHIPSDIELDEKNYNMTSKSANKAFPREETNDEREFKSYSKVVYEEEEMPSYTWMCNIDTENNVSNRQIDERFIEEAFPREETYDEESFRSSSKGVYEEEEMPSNAWIGKNDTENNVSNRQFNERFIDDIVQKKVNQVLSSKNNEFSFYGDMEMSQSNLQRSSSKRRQASATLTGADAKVLHVGALDQDAYSMMMLSKVWSRAWLLGILSFITQITLASIIISEQTETQFLQTTMSIPVKVKRRTRVAQFLAIILALMTQNEFLTGLRTILLLPYRYKHAWGKVVGIRNYENCTRIMWFQRVFIPNLLKSIQGGMVLVTSFIVIVQMTSTVDVLKDYSALFVISSVDDLFFSFADMGYLGEKLSRKADRLKDVKIPENEKRVRKILVTLFILLIIGFLGSWAHIVSGQIRGAYLLQAFPICPFDTPLHHKKLTFFDIVADNKCQFVKGEGTNIIECGWDGGDCEQINVKYPLCHVDDISKLGDGTCHNGTFNSKECGFDNGDCVDSNAANQMNYPKCPVKNIGWIGDGVCNGGKYYSMEGCERDGGDCVKCSADNLDLIGDGKCDKGYYNTAGCSYDGGDCLEISMKKIEKYTNCTADHVGWIGDGVCNGADYLNGDCGFDEGDCDDCIPKFPFLNLSRIGDGKCDDGNYNTKECSFDGGDCLKINAEVQKTYPGCFVQTQSFLGNSQCDGGEYNTEVCGFDGGDCIEFNAKYPDCHVEKPWLVGSGVCSGGEYDTPECFFDGGDCSDITCFVEFLSWIGDGFCDGGVYFTEDCDFDGGDCDNCKADNMNLVGDGICNGKEYNNFECGFDGGDCFERNEIMRNRFPNCNVKNVHWLGDGVCDGLEYSVEECGKDGGDCRSSCDIDDINLIGNGFCDQAYFRVECSWDGGDCDNCAVTDRNLIGDGICDGKEYNTLECGFDGGDCLEKNAFIEQTFPNCQVENIRWLGDGVCDGFGYSTEECGLDGGDCRSSCDIDNSTLLGDGFCDEGGYNVDGCSFDGNDCVPVIKSVGEIHVGDRKWVNGVIGSDSFFYFAPSNANKILKKDPFSNSTTFVGNDLGPDQWKWWGFIKGADGVLYGIPFNANSILSYDVASEEMSLIAEQNEILLSGNMKFGAGVLAENGIIYFIPFQHNKVVKFDPQNIALPLTEIGDDLGPGFKSYDAILGNDGSIYTVPVAANRVMKVDVENDKISYIGESFEGGWKWSNGVLAKDGNIYTCPLHAAKILQINIQTQTTHLVGPDLGNDEWKWSGFVEGKDGFLYGIPLDANKLLRFDPIQHTATLIPLEGEFHGVKKWWGGLLGDDGTIYGTPYVADQILAIEPLLFRP